jgi:hypothetical protein
MKQQTKKNKPSGSPDYPLYEKMKIKAPRAAIFWMAGDRLYHGGLLLTMLSIPFLFFVYTQWGTGSYFVWAGGLLIASIGVAALGIYFKRESYKLAIKAGIDVIHG